MAGDWSELPSELLQLIYEKLKNSELYLIRFRSVCSSWRSSTVQNYPSPFILKLPPSSKTNDDDSVFYLIKHNIYLIKSPTTPSISRLIRIGPDLNGKNHLWHPFHFNIPHRYFPHKVILDFNQLSVVDLGHVFYIESLQTTNPYRKKVVVATCPGEEPLIATINNRGRPWMLRCGDDDGWMMIPVERNCYYGDICAFKGRFYLKGYGLTHVVGPDLTVHFVDEQQLYSNYVPRFFFVQSLHTELLLVQVEKEYGTNDVKFFVYRLDEKEKKWVNLKNLGDMVLFLGDGCSFSVSASDLGFASGNCVIIMDHYHQMIIFHLDQDRFSPLSDYPYYFNLFLPLPDWIVRMQHL